MQLQPVLNMMTAGGPLLAAYVANPARVDAIDDRLARGGGLTGAADSKLITFSGWVKYTSALGMNIIFLGPAASQEGFRLTSSSGETLIAGRNSSNTEIIRFVSNAATNDDNWHHIMGSFDLNSTSLRHYYIDGVDAESPGVWSTYTDDTIDFTRSDNFIFSRDAGSAKYVGDAADFQVWTGVYTDLSIAANRLLFINGGKPVDPSVAAASLGTPIILLSGETSTWHINDGSGGGFTLVGGGLGDGSSPVRL